MKKLIYFLMLAGCSLLGAQLLADVTVPAATLAAAVDPSTSHTLLLVGLGAAFSMPLQAFIEHAIAEKPWMNNWAKSLKPLLPTLLAGVSGYVATRFGFNVVDVLTVVSSLVGGTHFVNASILASEAPEAGK